MRAGVHPRCPICSQMLSCETDWIGRMFYLHDRPCVPPPPSNVIGYCSNGDCGEPVRGDTPARRREILWCSEECHRELMEAKRLAVLATAKKAYQKKRRIQAGINRRDAA